MKLNMVTMYYNNARERHLQKLAEPRDGAWLHVEMPDSAELESLANEYGLDEDLLQDAIDLYESPRIAYEDKSAYAFVRYASSNGTQTTTLPLLLIYSRKHLISVAMQPVPFLDQFINQKIDFLTTQKTKMMLQLLDAVVGSYKLEVNKIGRNIRSLRGQLNKQQIDNRDFVAMIDVEEDLNDFLAALVPLNAVLRSLLNGRFVTLYEDDRDLIEDLSLGITEQLELARKVERLQRVRRENRKLMTA